MAIQRTAMGKAVDMSTLATRNEKTRAVGNMKVNARGDELDSSNRVVNNGTQRVKSNYANTITDKGNGIDTGLSFGDLTPDERALEADDEDIQK